MRIRITDVNSFQPAPYDDHPLYHFGVAVGDEFEVVDVHGYGFIVETDDGLYSLDVVSAKFWRTKL